MRFINIAVILIGFMVSLSSQAYTAALYEQNSGRKKLLFNMEVVVTPLDGDKSRAVARFTDVEGKLVVEQSVMMQGSQILSDEVIHHQTGRKGFIEIKNGKAFFTKTADGKTTTKEEKLEDTFVTSGNFQRFVKDNWTEIMKGQTVSFRYGVWDRQETVGFKIFKESEEKVGDKTLVKVKMKPSSFLIAAIVNPVIFIFPADGDRILEMNGRVAPKLKDGEKWKDLDADAVYSY